MKHATTRVPQSDCLNCGKTLDAASLSPLETDDRRPSPGDVAVCLHCSHFHMFKDDMTLRAATPMELLELSNDPDVLSLLRGMRKVRLSPQRKATE